MSAALTGTASSPGWQEVELSITGMTCAACAARVEKKLGALDDVTVAVNFATGRAIVTAPSPVPVARLIDAVEQAGYGADLVQPLAYAGEPGDAGGAAADAARVADLRRRLIVALVFFVPLSDLSVLLSLFPWARFPGWQWVLVVLATPAALVVACGRGAQLGIFIKGYPALEASRQVDTIVLDKTGTVTTAEMAVAGVQPSPGTSREELLRRLGGVEDASEHPVAAAIAAAARAELGDLPRAAGFVSLPGLGARGVVDGQEVIAGRAKLFGDRGITIPEVLAGQCAEWERAGRTVVLAGWGGQARGAVAVADTVKPSAAAAVAGLRGLGLRTVLLTGDSQAVASAVAAQIGADEVIAGALPAGFLNPLIAGAAMAASSAFVVASSIRLRRFGTAGRPGRGRRLGSAPSQAEAAEPQQETLPCPG